MTSPSEPGESKPGEPPLGLGAAVLFFGDGVFPQPAKDFVVFLFSGHAE